MDISYIKCIRELDERTIYIQSECSLSEFTRTLDALIDSEFINISKITDKKFIQLKSKDKSKACHIIDSKSYMGFIRFIEDNYVKTKEIMDRKQKSHKV